MRHAPLVFGTFVVILVAVILAPMVVDLSSMDADEHGRVPVPGQRVLELPEGHVGVWYGERRRMPARPRGDTFVAGDLPVPELRVRAAPL
ncbi:MAG TPA: hypothetical protein VHF89_05020 [Solirubrobacteraceae bacterium]|nr:hypothetical protein [Solirubrobacteraceae bacterium]